MTEGGPRGDSRQDEKGARQQESGTDAPGPEEAPLAARPPLPLPPETGTATGALPPPPPPPAAAIPKRRRVWPWIVGLVAAFIVGIALGAAGQTTETLTSTSSTTTTETTTVEADPATVTTTRVRTEVRLRPPPSSGVKVSYGDWEGLFRIHGANVTSDSFGGTITAQVVGQFEYLGGPTATGSATSRSRGRSSTPQGGSSARACGTARRPPRACESRWKSAGST